MVVVPTHELEQQEKAHRLVRASDRAGFKLRVTFYVRDSGSDSFGHAAYLLITLLLISSISTSTWRLAMCSE